MQLRRLIPFCVPQARWMVLALFFSMASVGAALVPPALVGRVVDEVFVAAVDDGDFAGRRALLATLILGIAVGTTVRATAIFVRNTSVEVFSQRVIRDLKQRMYDHIQGLSFDYFHKTRTGELMARVTKDIEMVRGVLVMSVLHGATGVFFVVGSAAILLRLHWPLAVVAVVTSPLLFWATYRLRRDIYPRFRTIRAQYSALNSVVSENIAGIRVVQSFSRQSYELDKFGVQNHGLSAARNRSLAVWATWLPFIEFLSGLPSALVLLAGGWMVLRGRITLGLWVQFNSYLWMLVHPMRMLGEMVNQIALAESSAERVFEVLDVKSAITSPARPTSVARIRGEVEFRGVGWSVDGQRILDGIDIHAPRGSTTAIIGPTGSGKSSLVHLIPRFYDPDRGQVLVDGIDVRELDLPVLRNAVGLVAQETFLFSETMYNNLTYGRQNMPIDFVQRVAAQTQAHFFIKSMVDGYDTVVGERGVGLSGGQKQRAGIARALLQQAPILILDDSTSAVDMETEALIQRALRNMDHSATTFIIAHRISSVKHADQIIVLDGGRVVEHGTHQALIRAGGLYEAYYEVQYAQANR